MEIVRPRGKLRNKIFWMMVMISAVPIFVAAFFTRESLVSSHRTDVANLESNLLNQKAGEISTLIGRSLVGSLNFNVSYKEKKDLDLATKKFVLTQVIRQNPAFLEIAFINLSGTETAKVTQAYPSGVADALLIDRSQSEEFRVTLAGTDYFGPVRFLPSGPVSIIASPVRNGLGDIISILAAEINYKPIQDIVLNANLGNSGYLYLVDKDGFLIGGGDGLMDKVATDMKNVGIVSSVLAGTDFLGSSAQKRYDNLSGQSVVAAARFLPDYGWGLVAEWPAAEADAAVSSVFLRNILTSVLVLLAAVVASAVLANLIVRPVRKLEDGTARVAEGKFNEPVTIKTNDELEELGSAFNEMMKGLKRLQELKDEFVFIAAHELKTPVAAMKGYLSLIIEGVTGPIAEKTREFINKVLKSNERLIQLVADLLEVARSEAGRLTIKVAPTEVGGPVREVLSELKSLADEKSIDLVYEPSASLPKAMADAERLKEVLVNLVGNAIRYTLGSGNVTVSHEVKDNYLITHVKDTGAGISKENQKRLFEKFYRVPDERLRETTGTGLGLFIVKEIVEKMNGKIWAESEGEGKGSTFSFSLPTA